MIIQCKQCKTKFRFDDALMEGDGLWMRCSRCQHVFFHDNPAKIKPAAGTGIDPFTVKAPDKAVEKDVRRPSFEPAVRETVVNVQKESVAGTQDEDMKSFMKEVIGEEKMPAPEPVAVSKPHRQDETPVVQIDFTQVAQFPPEQEEPLQEAEEKPTPPARKKSSGWRVALWSILVIIIIPAIVYFFLFPDLGERYIQIARKYIGGISQPTEGQVVMAQIKLQDIRQRIVTNLVLGNIRVVEGTAVNQADFPVSRVRIKGEILDAYAVVQGERVSFAGNALTEEELANMSEEDIQKRLSRPEGRNNINERVLPNGRIPFMIVFTKEKPGIIKTTVVVAGAERLL